MQSERLSSERVRDSARFVATELVREPVKIAVKDALREEAEIERTSGEGIASRAETAESDTGENIEYADDGSGESGGRSRRFWAGFLVSMAGVAYLARRRMSGSSSWSEESEDTGYSTEGEIQTGETAGEDVAPDDGGHSPTTEQ